MNSEWFKDGPQLPVEFVRESSGKRITLVIDKESKPIQTLWAMMPAENIEDAISALKEREGKNAQIDFVKATDRTDDAIRKIIVEWLHIKNIDVAIWTGLGSKFNGTNKRPTVEEVVTHLKNLKGEEKNVAEKYIRKAPKQVSTEYRKKIEAELGWTPI